jgi:hypothetical protein
LFDLGAGVGVPIGFEPATYFTNFDGWLFAVRLSAKVTVPLLLRQQPQLPVWCAINWKVELSYEYKTHLSFDWHCCGEPGCPASDWGPTWRSNDGPTCGYAFDAAICAQDIHGHTPV